MEPVEWDGEPLDQERLAMAVRMGDLPPGSDISAPSLAAACDGTRSCVLRPDQIGEFLSRHANARIACHGIDGLFWSFEALLSAEGDWPAWRLLWEIARGCRLHDVQLLELLCTGGGDVEPESRDLEAMAEAYATRHGLSGLGTAPLGRGREDTLRQADIILAIYLYLWEKATELVDHLGISRSLVARYGPLTVGLQGQAAITMGRITREGIPLQRHDVSEMRNLCERAYHQCSRTLLKDRGYRPCFEWADGQVRVSRSGLPDQKLPKLRAWLEDEVGLIPSTFGIPPAPPRTGNGKISVLPDFWGEALLVRPGLRAWSRLWTAAMARKALDEPPAGGEPRLRPQYDVVPRLRSRNPNLDRLRNLTEKGEFGDLSARAKVCSSIEPDERQRVVPETPLFRAPAGYTLVVGQLVDLAIRCFAEVCKGLGGESQLGGWLHANVDPAVCVARDLYAYEMATRRIPSGPETSEFEAEREAATIEFEAALGDDPPRLSCWIVKARALLDAMLTGRGADHARASLLRDHRVTISAQEAEQDARRLVEDVLPELGWLAEEDRTLEIVREKLGCARGEVIGTLPMGPPAVTAARLRSLIRGETHSPSTFAALRSICRREQWQEKLAAGRGSEQLYREIFHTFSISPIGRMRLGPVFCLAQSPMHLDLADDVMKAVLFAIVAGGHDLIAYLDGEFVVLIHEQRMSDSTLRSIRTIAETAAKEVIRLFPPRCETRQMPVW